jgi:hypothetical protein
MFQVGFELMTSEFERAKTVHALDCAGILIGGFMNQKTIIRTITAVKTSQRECRGICAGWG